MMSSADLSKEISCRRLHLSHVEYDDEVSLVKSPGRDCKMISVRVSSSIFIPNLWSSEICPYILRTCSLTGVPTFILHESNSLSAVHSVALSAVHIPEHFFQARQDLRGSFHLLTLLLKHIGERT
jgi:hypothetical protein